MRRVFKAVLLDVTLVLVLGVIGVFVPGWVLAVLLVFVCVGATWLLLGVGDRLAAARQAGAAEGFDAGVSAAQAPVADAGDATAASSSCGTSGLPSGQDSGSAAAG